MPSKAIFMLWIVCSTLPSALFAGGKDDKDQQAQDTIDAERFRVLYDKDISLVTDVFLGQISDGGKEFIHPDDPNKIVRIYKIPDDATFIINEQANIEKLMAKSEELGNIIPITQKLYRGLNFTFRQHTGISLEMERYRNDLLTGLMKDQVLRESLMDFASRLEMYKILAYSFQQFSAMGIKHCNIGLKRILYKKTGDDFSTNPLQETESGFTFVLSDFNYMTDLATPCSKGMPSFWDQEDAQGKTPKSDKCKGKIEIFGLGLLILKIETIVLMIKENGTFVGRPNNIQEAFQTMAESPPDISKYYNDKAAILNQSAHDIMTEIFNWIKYSNRHSSHVEGRYVQISADTLLQDLAYIEGANALVFEQRDFDRFPPLKDNSSVTGKVVANYTTFNKLLQTMLQPNDYVNGRPDAASTSNTLTKIQESYMANIKTLYRNRLLLV